MKRKRSAAEWITILYRLAEVLPQDLRLAATLLHRDHPERDAAAQRVRRDYLDFTFGRSEKTSLLPKEPMPWDTPEWEARARWPPLAVG